MGEVVSLPPGQETRSGPGFTIITGLSGAGRSEATTGVPQHTHSSTE